MNVVVELNSPLEKLPFLLQGEASEERIKDRSFFSGFPSEFMFLFHELVLITGEEESGPSQFPRSSHKV